MTPLDFSLSQADSDALEARGVIIGMRSKHSNLVVVLDAIKEAIDDAEWADFSSVSSAIESALDELNKVYASK